MADGAIDEILEEESEFVAILESEMKKHASRDFGGLIGEYMLHAKALYDLANEEYLDLVKDRVSYSDLSDVVKRHIKHYLFWLEEEHQCGTTPGSDPLIRQDWHSRRVGYMSWLLKALEIPALTVAQEMRRVLKYCYAPRFKHGFDGEWGIEHLISTMNTIKLGDKAGLV